MLLNNFGQQKFEFFSLINLTTSSKTQVTRSEGGGRRRGWPLGLVRFSYVCFWIFRFLIILDFGWWRVLSHQILSFYKTSYIKFCLIKTNCQLILLLLTEISTQTEVNCFFKNFSFDFQFCVADKVQCWIFSFFLQFN